MSSSDDDDLNSNPLLSRRAPSPTYGIRDLPQRTRNSIIKASSPPKPTVKSYTPPTRTRSLSRPTSPHQSVFRSTEQAPPVPRHPAISTSPPKGVASPSSSAPATKTQWPADLPRLPNPPSSPGPSSSPRSHSPARASSSRNPPTRKQSLRNPVANSRYSRPSPPDLDDAPPLPLRHTPSPDVIRAPIRKKSLPANPASRPRISAPPANGEEPPRGSIFSLSEFPQPPTQVPVSPIKSSFGPPSHSSRASMPARPHTSPRPNIPKISFPGNADSESDSDGPMIVVSDAGGAPKMGINASTKASRNVPTISVGGADTPQISVSGPSSSSRGAHHLPPLPAVQGKGGLVCGGCGGSIMGRIVSAMGARWHPGCFRCCVCNELLENLSSYEHEGRPYCHLDYHEVSTAVAHLI